MPIRFTCGHCKREYRKISRRYAGRKVLCSCGHASRLRDSTVRKDRVVQSAKPIIEDDFEDLEQLLEDDLSHG